ncbi:DinB family protein [Nocardioides insulae]|uniref:DinB family protein n=1 Tax=Nocardioides insulae TaxID=394734 RepID=UPI0003F91F10|nr:DinB family protein [Nocardioides insulae]
MTDEKATLQRYLDNVHQALLWKLEGLSERDLRLPRTPTGTNLLGILRHCVNVEFGYLGPVFGRMMENPAGLLEPDDYDKDPQADWYLTAEENSADQIALAHRVWAFSARTLAELPLDATGHVPWWDPGNAPTLHHITVHLLTDLTRHAGHADILREGIDGAAGMRPASTNLPDGTDWPAYVAKLTAIAEEF